MFDYNGLKIQWLGHDGFLISDGKTIIIDPFKVKSKTDKADILLITHEHFDHLSIEDIKMVSSERTSLVASVSCKEGLSRMKFKDSRYVNPGDKIVLEDVTIETIHAYNLNKFREPGKPFHPREDGKLGFVIQTRGVRIYHAGDTDFIPEMKQLKADLALLPVSGTYVMTPQEAATAAAAIKPKLAIPMHFGAIVGSEKDALEFKRLAPCDVQILRPE